MNNKIFAYGRISSSSQENDNNRQLEAFKQLNINERDVFFDVKSGKDFERTQYKLLKSMLRENDILVIKSIDRLGRNYDMILNEWRDITKNIKAHIKVIDMPMLDTTQQDGLLKNVINDIILSLLSYVAEQERLFIRQRQREGIDLALKNGTKTGRNFGRPKINKPENFDELVLLYKEKRITAKQCMQEMGLKNNTFYNLLKEEA